MNCLQRKKGIIGKLNGIVIFFDKCSFWWVGILLLAVTFLPYLILGGGSVFEIHDQLDETILTYVLNARHLGDGTDVFPELLGGVNKTGMQPSAVLFIPLYRFLPSLAAFLLQYAVAFLSGFMGMYFSVKRITASSILATAMAACFCLLPIQPVYGLSVFGVPLLLYAFLCLYDGKNKGLSYLLIVFFGLTTHLVLIGYVVLGLWAIYIVSMLIRKKNNPHIIMGFVLLTSIYVLVNYSLFMELIFGNSAYVSHREEVLNGGMPFWSTVIGMFLESGQHASSLHKKLILPIVIILLAEAFFMKNKIVRERKLYFAALAGFVGLFLIAVFCGVCNSEPAAEWRNTMHGFFRYFQMNRFYWLYPAGWYLEFALAFRVFWGETNIENAKLIKLLILFAVLLPTMQQIKVNSNFYMNVNQINNGSGITGYITWENYYAEDLMEELENAIGRDMSTYRVAHLGISPCPSLMHGFYTVDGYSNNYPLEYKHKFRQVIAKELEKSEATRVYFDTWGSRCYLFNAGTGNYYMIRKNSDIKYENLAFDMNALRELGCEYIFSGGEILDAARMGLEPMGYFETETSYWGIWLYRLKN